MQLVEQSYPKMHIFVSGPAGSGKSLLIKAITQATIWIVNKNILTQDTNSAKILLTAPTGKAAYNIGGTTLHSAFALPIHHRSTITPLNGNTVHTLSIKMAEIKTLIIDENSMCSRDSFMLVDVCLQQIMNLQVPFGGLNVLVFGDLFQLPPVGAILYLK